MSLTETVSFDKEGRIERNSLFRKLFLTLTVVLVGLLGFGLGLLTGRGAGEGSNAVKIEYDPALTALMNKTPTSSQTASIVNSLAPLSKPVPANTSTGSGTTSKVVVASKNGTKYHFPHCPGAKQIKEANKITFASPEDAEASGYTRAANCVAR